MGLLVTRVVLEVIKMFFPPPSVRPFWREAGRGGTESRNLKSGQQMAPPPCRLQELPRAAGEERHPRVLQIEKKEKKKRLKNCSKGLEIMSRRSFAGKALTLGCLLYCPPPHRCWLGVPRDAHLEFRTSLPFCSRIVTPQHGDP